MVNSKKRIMIDLDGVLNNYSTSQYKKNKITDIKDGAIQFLEALYKHADLYLFTSRNLMLAVKWLIQNGIDKYFIDVTNTKIPSYLYIDDRCICFDSDYKETLDKIKKFKVYWS